MIANATSISSIALLIVRTLEDYGYSGDSLLRQVGLDPKKLGDSNARYPMGAMQQLWNLAVDLTNDEGLGLKVATHWHPTTFHALGYAWLASGSIKDAMERAVRYSRIVNDVIKLSFDYANGAYKLSYTVPFDDYHPVSESIDAAAAIFVVMVRQIYGKEINPILVTLPRVKPKNAATFNEFFCSPIEYDNDELALYFLEEQVEKPLLSENVELAHANDKVVREYLSHMDRTYIAMQVKSKLVDCLPSGEITEQEMANTLNVSLRSLQRKLKEEGTGYKEILEEVRRELAGQYIKNSRLSIGEITFLLGFTEPSNFTRAFKRWHGISPSEFRAAM